MRWLRGLRARLVAAFALVTIIGAVAAAWASAAVASNALVDSYERQLTQTVTEQITAVAPSLTYPLDQTAVDRLRATVGDNTLVTYEDLRSSSGAAVGLITPQLREAVRTGERLVAQRISADAASWLLIGTPIMITGPDGTRERSGVEVYVVRDLADVERQIDDVAAAAAGTAALALPLAGLLALMAAASVLRPVRTLRDTARRLAAGDLDARSQPRGSDELAELTATVNDMAGSVQASMTAMQRMQADAKRFAADVSHELRTPLSTLTAVVEVLEGATADLDEDARESAQMAIVETQRLVRLVEDLMEVSRFDAGTAVLRLEPGDIVAAVAESLRARGWLDRVRLAAPAQAWVRMDRRRVDVIVANLVGNALRHGEPPIEVRIESLPGRVRIEVADAGPGLSASVLPLVFERFYKADAARTRSAGSGLGLAIAWENARLHGGELSAENREEGGACFVLCLPDCLEEP